MERESMDVPPPERVQESHAAQTPFPPKLSCPSPAGQVRVTRGKLWWWPLVTQY
jgi:hypothetical protein